MSMGELINHAKMHNIQTPTVLETKKRGKYRTGLTGQEKIERRYVYMTYMYMTRCTKSHITKLFSF